MRFKGILKWKNTEIESKKSLGIFVCKFSVYRFWGYKEAEEYSLQSSKIFWQKIVCLPRCETQDIVQTVISSKL